MADATGDAKKERRVYYADEPSNGPTIVVMLLGLLILGFALYTRMPGGAKARASHILVEDEVLARSLKEDLMKGADFATLAKRHSKCPSGKSKGGSLGEFAKGSMVPEFDRVVFSPESEVGVVYGPVKTSFGYHLIKIQARQGVREGEEL